MEEGYVRPEQFLFSVVTSVLLGMIMNAATQPRQTEGRQTMFGIPKTDVERLMSHYGITEEEACELLASYPIDQLLPERGSGLAPVEIVGSSQNELASALELMESGINYGESARVRLCTEGLPEAADLAQVYLDVLASGHHISYPTSTVINGIPTTEFVIRKGSPQWQLIVPLLVPLFTIGLVTFGITKIESITKALVPIILISIGGLIVLAAVLSKPATKYIERGGKVPYLPATNGGPGELEKKVHSLWIKACEWEKIPIESKFVVFSDENPYLKEYNEAVSKLLRFKQFQHGEWKPAVTKSSKKALAVR
ncbi:MAG: hypothetical protein Q8O55_04435 [Dehalococcoidales bacterium]|nr:hypothetical protein [Dehalococcoidales bacterium]